MEKNTNTWPLDTNATVSDEDDWFFTTDADVCDELEDIDPFDPYDTEYDRP